MDMHSVRTSKVRKDYGIGDPDGMSEILAILCKMTVCINGS